jgi:tRNA-specific adenosine deaminase 2
MEDEDLHFFNLAMEVAREALPLDEVPVGCVVVRKVNSKSTIVCKSHNWTNKLKDPLAHAEYLCVKSLVEKQISLENLTFYITLEPCAMCVGVLERIGCRIMFGFHNDLFGSRKILNKDVGKCLNIEAAIDLLKDFYKTPNDRTSHMKSGR